MKKAIVTGGAGFIGSYLVDQLINIGVEVTILDNLSTGKKENINPKAKCIDCDISTTSYIELTCYLKDIDTVVQ